MNIDYVLYPRKKNYRIAVRVRYNKFDVSLVLNLFIDKLEDWDIVTQQTKTSSVVNQKLLELKAHILKRYNENYVSGTPIDKAMLTYIVRKEFERPLQEFGLVNKDKNIYLSNYIDFWTREKARHYKVSRNKVMEYQTILALRSLAELISRYEQSELPRKMVLSEITQGDIYQFISWLESEEYSNSTIGKYIDRMKFILNRAFEDGLKVSNVRSQRIYIDEDNEVDGVALSELEIDKIFETDVTHDPVLSLTKDNFTIGIFTGLRSIDFIKRLDLSNFKNGYIELKTQKTKTKVVIPVHEKVNEVLERYGGNLPPKQSPSRFNENLRKLCELSGIDYIMEGRLWNGEKRRKILGDYPKYKLISTHTLRRSFVTIYKDVLDRKTLCDILGWSTGAMLKVYDMTTKKESADKLKVYWEKKKYGMFSENNLKHLRKKEDQQH